jgi:hypothetical protein
MTNAQLTTHDDAPTIVLPIRPEGAAQAGSAAPSLADAFSALLAAEQGEAGAPLATLAAPGAVDSEALVEAVTRRVLERMTDAAVRDIVTARVLDVAERVVREEIERIKAMAEE